MSIFLNNQFETYQFAFSFASISQGLAALSGSATPFIKSLSRLARPIAQAPVALFRPHTKPTAAKVSMRSFDGLNCLEIPNSEAA
mmetsp:Transcript_37128/g.41005  ORF Transcript_37128/g.41005 Transcript_37128/m.41005 type:complete len:85 (+) Transcript_37128:342-596(+)